MRTFLFDNKNGAGVVTINDETIHVLFTYFDLTKARIDVTIPLTVGAQAHVDAVLDAFMERQTMDQLHS